MKFLIIDDDKEFANQLKETIIREYAFKKDLDISIDMINDHFDHIEIQEHYHLLLCDLILGGDNGIDIGKELFAKNSIDDIAYISANNNLIFDVLPYDPLFFVRKSNLETDLAVLMNIFLNKYSSDKYIDISCKGNKTKILEKHIMYIEVEGRYVRITTIDHEDMDYTSLKDFIELLDETKFVQINKYTVINLDYLVSYGAENVMMKDGKEILLGRAFKPSFKQKYMEYFL